jgi:predicted nucleotidyltransferase
MDKDNDENSAWSKISKFLEKDPEKLVQKRTKNFSSEEYEVMNRTYKEIRRRFPDVKRIDLFGSRARNDFRKDSDYDFIAVRPGEQDRLDLSYKGNLVQIMLVPEFPEDWLNSAATIQLWPKKEWGHLYLSKSGRENG